MAEEMNEGSAYLMALRQASGAPAAATARQGDATLGPQSPLASGSANQGLEQFQGAEKRRSVRYKCEGSAEVREDGCDVPTWAAFTDISLHGCYVEAQATYPPGTILHMKLEAKGVRVEAKGIVRVTYPYLGMGIAFSEMSEEDKCRLRQLVTSLSHSCVVMGPGITSSLQSGGTLEAVPLISDPAAAVQAIVGFFEHRHTLVRDEFLRILKKSQK